MNNQSYGCMHWIQPHAAAGDSEVDILENGADTGDGVETAEYLVNGNTTDEDLDHMAAENLIFMARDGQLSEIIAANDSGRSVLVSADGSAVTYAESFDDDAQVVTEEVITDDWVQHQGAERVEIAAEQIAGNSSSQELLDMEQDEYTALRPYPCDFCSRRFRKKAILNNHMLAHQNDRPYLCKLCGSRFSRRAELISHVKAHAEPEDTTDLGSMQESATSVKFEPQHRPMDDHYYEHEWPMYQEQNVANSTVDIEQSTYLATTSAVTNVLPAAPTTRGRISRLKPKEEMTQYIMIADKPSISELEYVETAELHPPVATVDLTQPAAQAERQQLQYPVLDESKPFVCQQCGLAFAREKALVSHIKNHRVESPFECNQCQEMFWDSNSLQEHQKTHKFEESNSEYDPTSGDDSASETETEQLYGDFYCSECGICFHRQDLLRRHLKQHDKIITDRTGSPAEIAGPDGNIDDAKDDSHCCHTCGKFFSSALELLAHAEIHARFPPFKCVLCGSSFYEELAIKRHLHARHSHELRPNSCVLCGKECRDRKALIKHAWDHSREKCHSCSKCGKNFHNKARLKRHMASHRDKSVVCEVCQEEFPDGRSLSNHRHSHSTTSPGKLFPCHECGKTFGSRSSQQIHVRIHTGERPYGCRFCWKAFADGGTLRKHERIHTGEKPYACSVCPRAFNQRVVLREHIRSHHSGLDVARGTFYCTVCTMDLSSSNDLIQHLIQHSDSNTAKQRQPITGPRKYKRRRKLQPHEIAHLRAEHKDADGDDYGSEIDICDFDMNNVDDLFDIPESNSKGVSKEKRKKAKGGSKSVANGSAAAATETSVKTTQGSKSDGVKPRTDSSNSNLDKLWDDKFMQASSQAPDDSYKGLFQIDSLVVVNDTPLPIATSNSGAKTRRSAAKQTMKSQLPAKPVPVPDTKSNSTPSTTASRNRCRKKGSKAVTPASRSSSRPRMIHTEKSRVPAAQDAESHAKKPRSKTYVKRTETTNLSLLASGKGNADTQSTSTNIVDDYEIISPATQPPNQISSSPLHIKQELEQRVQCMYDDTHLLIETTLLRDKSFEKYNPGIVNSLEDILRSPEKSDRNARLRFTSESSTTPQFLPEEDQHLIKIESISPDLRDMVESQQRITATATTPTSSSSARTTRHLRQLTVNSKYDVDNGSSRAGTKRAASGKTKPALNSKKPHTESLSLSTRSMSSSTPSPAKISLGNSLYLNYGVCYNGNVPVTVTNADASSGFFSISECVSAADAADAAAKAAAADKTQRKTRSFECEMCSAIFYDRAQLLDHVHIHI